MLNLLAVIVLLDSVLGADWLDLEARMAHKNVESLLCENNLLNYQAWPNLAIKEDMSYKNCVKECNEGQYIADCKAISYFEGNKTCMFKSTPLEGASIADLNGVFNQSSIAVTSWHKLCSTRFEKSSPFDVEAAEEGFCLLKDFRLGGTALGEAVLTNSTDECHAKCSQQGSKCTAFTIQDGKCTFYGDGYSVLFCASGNCYSSAKLCYFHWSATEECLDSTCARDVELTSKDLLIEYIAHSEMPQKGRKDLLFFKENGDEMGALQLHSNSAEKEISLLLTSCSKGQKNGDLATFYENPEFLTNEVRRFVISINSTGVSVRALSHFKGKTVLLWDDLFATDPSPECAAWNGTEIKKIGFRSWAAYGAMWTTVNSGAGIVGLSAVIMAVWAVIIM